MYKIDKLNSVLLGLIFVIFSNIGYWAVLRGTIKLLEIITY
jgi:hypothetical protein